MASRTRDGRVVGVDTGGTFTDLVAVSADGEERVHKLPSTPADPARAVLEGLAALDGARAGDHVVHGTTVALNALLEGRVARTALVANAGFADLLEIGRQERPELYALEPEKPAPLVPPELRFEVKQRSWPDPDTNAVVEVERPSDRELAKLARAVERAGVEAVAVCLLHAYADPEPERRVARALERLGVPVTCSAELLPEHREVERFSTAVVNAALAPRTIRYLGDLAARVAPAALSVLQSSGGTLPAERAGAEPVRVLASGPAGGVVGAAHAARDAGLARIASLDMGGTSTDVAFARPLEEGDAADRTRSTEDHPQVAGHPIAVPALDLHAIGCGGGSLVRVDAAGVLHVGPASAGADPGPVCYGDSDAPTVTDAHVQLGHVASGAFLGGALELDTDAVARAFEALGKRLRCSADDAAQAVLDAARAAMRRAIGVMTLQRGEDPERVALVAFGGAGGLHAAALASALRMPCALVPRHPGALSAWGMTRAAAELDAVVTALEPLAAWPRERRRAARKEVEERLRASLREGGARGALATTAELDLRYAGQSYVLRVPEGADPERAFHAAHERLCGYRLDDRAVELVHLRVRVAARPTRGDATGPEPRPRRLPAAAVRGERRARLGGRVVRAPVVAREALPPGTRVFGPALVEEYSCTTLVPPGVAARVVRGGHLRLEPAGPARRR